MNHTAWREKPQDPPGSFDLPALPFSLEYELAAKGGTSVSHLLEEATGVHPLLDGVREPRKATQLFERRL